MAIAFDAAVNAVIANPGTSLTWSHTCTGSNGILFVGVYAGVTSMSTVPTYAGVNMTLIGSPLVDGSSALYLYYLINPATGANNVVVTTGSSVLILGSSASYTGAKQSGQPDNNTTHGFSSTNGATVSLTTVADNCWTFMVVRTDSSGNSSASTGSTQRANTSGFIQLYDSNGAITPAGSYSMSVTYGAGTEVGGEVMASFSPAVATVNNHFLSLAGAGI